MNVDIQALDERRDIVIPGDSSETIRYCVDHFFSAAKKSLSQEGLFSVALSGGSTPKAIYAALSKDSRSQEIDWKKVLIFFSDERSVLPNHIESNFHMAMESGLKNLPIPEKNIFRMEAEKDIEEEALEYERLIIKNIPNGQFSLVMLGMGEDGHTASLFPETHGLHTTNRLVIANYVPKLNTWRMSLTYECINQAKVIAIYVLGESKAFMVKEVLLGPYQPDHYPIQKVGTAQHKALWILDNAAAALVR